MKRLLLLFFFLSFCLLNILDAQQLDHKLGEYLVKAKQENLSAIIADNQHFQGRSTDLKVERLVSAPMDIWLLTFDYRNVHEQHFLNHLFKHPGVEVVQFNHLPSYRAIPNDTDFDAQWQWLNTGQTGGSTNSDIDTDLAWDITTGGLTTAGDTIVIAIIDDGIDLTHPDFGDNLWVNQAEIPNNDLDDDNNGYIDDFLGWNIVNDNDDIGSNFAGGHGTPVAGLIGAQGDNAIGVTGVNWNVKMMIVRNDFFTDEASILESYTYVLDQRRLYNDTDGDQGAFVVATNLSIGQPFALPSTTPLWCQFYDTLGMEGIINIAAVPDFQIDVDLSGDVPSNCTSDFLIAVTGTDASDVRNFSAFGNSSVDLAAPGENIYTTINTINGTYGNVFGASFASPLVAGTVGLLYSAACPDFLDLAKNDPATAALLTRGFLLQGIDPIANLETETVTGGRLNANTSLLLILNYCSSCPIPIGLEVGGISDEEALLTWAVNDSAQTYLLEWRPVGSPDWTVVDDAEEPFLLQELEPCTDYEYRVQSVCQDTSSNFSAIQTFTTTGCGACLDFNYCSSFAVNSATEWVERVTIKDIDNISGDNGGYIFFPDITTALTVDSAYTIEIEPGFNFSTFNEYFKVWIDWDQDGELEEPSELAFDGGFSATTVTGQITVPSDAEWGLTRMRVSMKFAAPSLPCEAGFTFGEVEDYCIDILPPFIPCQEPLNLDTTAVGPFTVVFDWEPPTPTVIGYNIRYRQIDAADWVELVSVNASETLEGLSLCEEYELQIRTICETDFSFFSPSFVFRTACSVNTTGVPSTTFTAKAFPNPFHDKFALEVDLEKDRDICIEVFDLSGKRLHFGEEQQWQSGRQVVEVNVLNDQPSGLYFVRLSSTTGEQKVLRVVKQ